MSIGDQINVRPALAKLDSGRVINRTFAVVGRNLVPFLFLSVIAAVPYLLMELALLRAPPLATLLSLTGLAAAFVNQLLAMITQAIATAFTFLAWAGIAHGTFSDLNGKRASLGDCLATGLSDPLTLMGIAIASNLAISLGMLALLVPGIMLAMSWSLLVPIRVVEHTPFRDTFRRSSDLTRGNRGAIFGLYVIVAIAAGVLVFATLGLMGFGLTGMVRAARSPIYLSASSAINAVTIMITGTGVATIYYELRAAKEGIGPEQLAAVFD